MGVERTRDRDWRRGEREEVGFKCSTSFFLLRRNVQHLDLLLVKKYNKKLRNLDVEKLDSLWREKKSEIQMFINEREIC